MARPISANTDSMVEAAKLKDPARTAKEGNCDGSV
jgi:hypothetical protein